MRNVPKDLSEEAVAKWLGTVFISTRYETRSSKQAVSAQARAVLALVREKVREAVIESAIAVGLKSGETTNEVVARVMRDKEAPRG